jgi:hypothetical protein
MWYAFALIWIASVAGIFWAYGRKRRQASSARAKELTALLVEAKNAGRIPADGAPPGAAPVVKPVAAAQAETFTRRDRLLGKADAWLYLLFRTGLPDHEIFANVALSELLDPAPELRGIDREQRLRKLGQTFLNIVVCNKQLEIVAVVLYPAADAQAAEAQRYAEYCLGAAGIRLVRIDPAALPRHHQLRALVYAEDPRPAG